MLKIYCLNCSQPTFYTNPKPKVCPFCANPFDGVAVAQVKKPVLELELEEEKESPNEPSLPDIKNLDFELSVGQNKGISLKDIIFEPKIGLEPRKAVKFNKKKFQEEWKKEAGTTGRGSSTEVE